jgi:hypothetical protein
MWLKKRRTNALLLPLAEVIGGTVSDGRLTGSYDPYSVTAQLRRGYPIKYTTSVEGGVGPAEVNMLQATLAGVAGRQAWHCQSSAGVVHGLASRFTAGRLLEHFEPGTFKFEGVDTLNDAFERMGANVARRLGMPLSTNADPVLQERLIAAGLFQELDALRWGGHPYLPKAQFVPGARELAEQVYFNAPAFARVVQRTDERARAAGFGDYRSMIEAKAREAEADDPGRLVLEVEVGGDPVPSPERFRELLDQAVRIAQLNAEVNQPE